MKAIRAVRFNRGASLDHAKEDQLCIVMENKEAIPNWQLSGLFIPGKNEFMDLP